MASPTKDASNMLTPREVELLAKVWKCLKVAPEVDLHKLAHECGMTNVGSASNAWGRIRKKLFADTNGASDTRPTTPNRKRKNAPSAEDTTSDDKDMGEGPATVPEEGTEDSGTAEAPATPKRRRGAAGSSPAKSAAKRAPRTPRSAKKTPVKVEASDDSADFDAIDGSGGDGGQDTLVDGAV